MVTLKKLLYLVIAPIMMITVDLGLINDSSLDSMGVIGYILLVLLHIGVILAMYAVYLYEPDYKFNVGIERMPMICFGLGYDDGVIYIVLPFVTIAFGWHNDRYPL